MKKTLKIGTLIAFLFILAQCKQKAAELAGDIYPVSAASGDAYSIDSEKSVINWTASKVSGKHNGTVKLKSGSVSAKGDSITGGRIVIDLPTIANLDLEGTPYKAKLEGHLKDTDFFEVGKFPEGFFEIASITPTEKDGLEARGNLTLKGISKGITFPVTVVFENGKPVSAKGTAKINRQQWGIVYKGMPDDLINDEIILDFNLLTKI